MWGHCPIHGSQINMPAKLFKRFTPTETINLNGTEIEYENNYYRAYANIPYTEAADKQQEDGQPIGGLISSSEYMVIKFNGSHKPKPGDPREPAVGDILLIDREKWIIESGIQRVRIKSLINFAVVYLPLRKIS